MAGTVSPKNPIKNILVKSKPPEAEQWWVKIADFGITKRAESAIGPATLRGQVGTEGFLAPELLGDIQPAKKNGVRNDQPADIWAIGEISFRMLTGVPAFPDRGSVSKWVKSQEAPQFDQFPTDIRDFLVGIMHYDPEQRLTADKAMSQAWMYAVEPPIPLTMSLQPASPAMFRQRDSAISTNDMSQASGAWTELSDSSSVATSEAHANTSAVRTQSTPNTALPYRVTPDISAELPASKPPKVPGVLSPLSNSSSAATPEDFSNPSTRRSRSTPNATMPHGMPATQAGRLFPHSPQVTETSWGSEASSLPAEFVQWENVFRQDLSDPVWQKDVFGQTLEEGKHMLRPDIPFIPHIPLSFISSGEQTKLQSLFRSMVGTGKCYLSGGRAVDFFAKSNLPSFDLGSIWWEFIFTRAIL